MPYQYHHPDSRLAIIENVIAYAKKNLSSHQVELLIPFISHYFSTVAEEDLAERTVENLYGMVLSHWQFLEARNPSVSSVHVFNPEFENEGWKSKYTVIEIASPDMPFIVDSIRMNLTLQHNLTIQLMVYPGGMYLRRDETGSIVQMLLPAVQYEGESVTSETVLYIEVNRQPDPHSLAHIERSLKRVLKEVATAVEGWGSMQEAARELNVELSKHSAKKLHVTESEYEETLDFLNWLLADNFTFLGMCDFVLDKAPAKLVHQGACYGHHFTKMEKTEAAAHDPAARLDLFDHDKLLLTEQLTEFATIHRPAQPYCLAFKRFNAQGEVCGERRFFGLYTSVAYHSEPATIPLLRLKVEHVMRRSGLAPRGGSGRQLMNILETFPRDDLFQIDENELFDICMGIMQLQERQRVRLFMWQDRYSRTVSCLIYVPRERFTSELREKMGAIVQKEVGGTGVVSFATRFSESVLARIHFVIRLPLGGEPVSFDVRGIESKLVEAERTWEDELEVALFEHFGEAHGNDLYRKYCKAFHAGYKERYSVRSAVHDVFHIEQIKEKEIEVNLFSLLEKVDSKVFFKIYFKNRMIVLSDVLPILENMGFRVLQEYDHEINAEDGTTFWMSEFILEPMAHKGHTVDVQKIRSNFHDVFLKVWFGEAENDSLNQLVLLSDLNAREVSLIRAYSKYFKQMHFTFSHLYISETLARYHHVAKKLVKLFHAYFDPEIQAPEQKKIDFLKQEIIEHIDAVTNLDEDKILRQFLSAIDATLRTNFYQTQSDEFKKYISLKLNPSLIPEMPLPYPAFEIFVYSTRVEGVHLRAAIVARGGIRWSDRREDFRTEILGLMKAQKVKNAVIVPSGAKGGFILKSPLHHADRDALQQEAIACYSIFIRGLLDVTDNIEGDKIVAPHQVVRKDGNDPYLVVAADKGTASFSDIANAIAAEYQFWLGDAFASGGSKGYDHKKIGITAKGGWESVKRHFRELGRDIQNEPFTVIGVGDMSGDVFGNGMILSKKIKLIAAFNGSDIFIDPNPDCEKSYQERLRLFQLPRSGWGDYSPEVLSKGGGIFKRALKSITLSPEAMAALHVEKAVMSPNELIRTILRAPVDLLWNGGIGTYVKSSKEQHVDVGDKANDPVRVNGHELRCQVIGEGGNLGFTQLGRIEYALNGGVCYTDFVDNVGGVDCSDHEVNMKILLDKIVAQGDLTSKQRDTLLRDMEGAVAELVIKDAYEQTQAISLAASRHDKTLSEYARFIRDLEGINLLNRQLEFLPNEEEIANRKAKGIGLTRPEISILISYGKMLLKERLVSTPLVLDDALLPYLEKSFPAPVSQQFKAHLLNHRLRRELVATQVANEITNKMSATFVKRLYSETGANEEGVARSFIVASSVFTMDSLWNSIQSLDNEVPGAIQSQMLIDLVRLVRRATRWFLRNYRISFSIEEMVRKFQPAVKELHSLIPELLTDYELSKVRETTKVWVDAKVPEELAVKIAISGPMSSALDIVGLAQNTKLPLRQVAEVYFRVGSFLQLDWFRFAIIDHPVATNWDTLARAACKDDLDRQQRSITESVLRYQEQESDLETALQAWYKTEKDMVDRWRLVIEDLRTTSPREFTMFTVALRELLDLAQTSLSRTTQK